MWSGPDGRNMLCKKRIKYWVKVLFVVCLKGGQGKQRYQDGENGGGSAGEINNNGIWNIFGQNPPTGSGVTWSYRSSPESALLGLLSTLLTLLSSAPPCCSYFQLPGSSWRRRAPTQCLRSASGGDTIGAACSEQSDDISWSARSFSVCTFILSSLF